MYQNENRLFSRGDLGSYLSNRGEQLKAYINSMGLNAIPNDDVLLKELSDRYLLHAPVLIEGQIKIKAQEDNITLDNRNSIFFEHDGHQTYTTKGLDIVVEVPFNGNAELFYCRPSTYMVSGMPCAEIKNEKLILKYKTAEKDSEKIKRLWLSDIEDIKKYLEWIKRDINDFNNSLENNIKSAILKRKQEAQSNKSLIDAINN